MHLKHPKTFIIAEAGVNHNGSDDMALQLVDVAARCGVDAVKFQTFTADKLVRRGAAKVAYQQASTGGGDQHSMLASLEMSEALHRRLFERCAEQGIEFMSTPFDEDAANFLVGMGMKRIKIPSGEITNHPFLRFLAQKNCPLILSTGMATLEEIHEAVDVIHKERIRTGLLTPLSSMLTVLHCTSNYPAEMSSVNLRAMGTIAASVGVPVGYSDHTLGLAVSTAAVALGAKVIEKHFTLDISLPGPDHKASLTPVELAALVAQIRDVEIALGSEEKRPNNSELPVRKLVRRSVTSACDLRAGVPVTDLDLCLLRPGTGIPPSELDVVLGRAPVRIFLRVALRSGRILFDATMTRRICYLTGTRADFGLMVSTLHAIEADTRLNLQLIVTGMHLSQLYGGTISEVESEGFEIAARVIIDSDDTSASGMAMNLGRMLLGFVPALQTIKPDMLLLLGDRGEMLAGALAAIHLGIPVVHLHGGERSGTVDEPVRHAISKLAHLHLVSTTDARDRLIRMGERGDMVHVVGAPGLDGLVNAPRPDRESLCAQVDFDPIRPVGLLVFHPVLQESSDVARQVREVLDATTGMQILAVMPNSDAGSQDIRQVLSIAGEQGQIVLKTHLRRDEYIGWLAACDVLLGNSSSGIIEAASFGTPVVNIGQDKISVKRNINVIDVPVETNAIRAALTWAVSHGRYSSFNVYGDGQTGNRIVEFLATTVITPDLLAKCNAY